MSDDAQWFESLGTCRCGKPATGRIRGRQNQDLGPACSRCASQRITKAKRERERAEMAQKVTGKRP